MKNFILILFICLTFISCSKKESIQEISVNKNESATRRDVVDESKIEVKNSSAANLNRISSKEVKSHIGDSLIITGFVADIFLSDKVAYLNFENKFPKNIFSCAIFSGKFDEFGDLSRFKNKNVAVTGKILTYKGKPQIILNSIGQIKIISNE